MTTIRMRKGAKPVEPSAITPLEIVPCKTLRRAYSTLLPMVLICFIKSTMTYVIKSHVMITLVETYPSVLHIAGAWTFWTCSMDLFLRVPVQAALRLHPPLTTYLALGLVRMGVAGIALWQFAELRAVVVDVNEAGAHPEVFHLTVVMALIALETLLVKCSIDRFKLDWINTTVVICAKTEDLEEYDALVSMTRTLGAAVSITWTMKHESILAPLASPVNRTYAFIGINLSLCTFQMLLAIYVNWVNPYIRQTYDLINKNRGDVSFVRDVSSRIKKEFHQIFFCYLKKDGRKTIMVKRIFLTMTENFILNDFSWVFLVGVCKKHMDTISGYLNLMSGLEYVSSNLMLPPNQTREGHQRTLSNWLLVMLAGYACVAVAIWLPMPPHQVAVAAQGGLTTALNATVTAVTTALDDAVTAVTTAPYDMVTAATAAPYDTVTAATAAANATMTALATALNTTVTAVTTATNATMTAVLTALNATVTAVTAAPIVTMTAVSTAINGTETAVMAAVNSTPTAVTTALNATATANTTALNATATANTTALNATVSANTTVPNVPVIAAVPPKKFGWKTGLFYAGMITVAMTVPHVKGLSSFLSETGPVNDDFEDGQLLSHVVADLVAGILGSSVTFALNDVEYYKWILSCSMVITVLGLSSWFLLWLPRSWLQRLGLVKNDLYNQ